MSFVSGKRSFDDVYRVESKCREYKLVGIVYIPMRDWLRMKNKAYLLNAGGGTYAHPF